MHLRETKVHHLIKELIHNHEVIAIDRGEKQLLPNTLLVEHTKVVFKYLHQVVQKLHNHGDVRVSLRQCQQIQIAALAITLSFPKTTFT